MWTRFALALTAELCREPGSWRILGYDLRGHGAASDTAATDRIDQHVTDLANLLDALDVSAAHVVGLSLGGAVAQAAALTIPTRLASVSALGTSSVFPRATMTQRAELGASTPADHTDETLRRWFSAATLAAGGPAIDYVRACLTPTSSTTWRRTWLSLADFDVADRLSEIAVPVLAVAGSHDSASPPTAVRRIAEGVAQGRYQVIAGAAHLLCLERPNELARCVAEFLTDLSDVA
jgi:3-oxoadipate enol-lactonase